MQVFTAFERATGEIDGTLFGDFENILADLQAMPSKGVVSGEFEGDIYYVTAGQAVVRPRLILPETVSITADGSDAFQALQIPVGTKVIYIDGNQIIDDGEFLFSTELEGDYYFQFEPPWPYQTQTLKITAANS